MKALKECESICYKWWGLYAAAHSNLQSIISGTWRRISISTPLLGWRGSPIWRPGRRNSIMWTWKNTLITQRTLTEWITRYRYKFAHVQRTWNCSNLQAKYIAKDNSIKLNIMHRPLHTLLVEFDSHIQDGALLLTVHRHRLLWDPSEI